jgi:hypothetical protein
MDGWCEKGDIRLLSTKLTDINLSPFAGPAASFVTPFRISADKTAVACVHGRLLTDCGDGLASYL